jgi:mannose-6-phosphate isomerase-like protein (cupin superfamily)
MRAKIIRSTDGVTQDFGNMLLKNMLNDSVWPFSINWIKRTSNEAREGFETDQDVAFYVLDGSGEVMVDGKIEKLSKGDVIAFPREVSWKFFEGLTLLAISSPPYDRAKRKYVEE